MTEAGDRLRRVRAARAKAAAEDKKRKAKGRTMTPTQSDRVQKKIAATPRGGVSKIDTQAKLDAFVSARTRAGKKPSAALTAKLRGKMKDAPRYKGR